MDAESPPPPVHTCCSVWLTPSKNTSSDKNMAAAVFEWMLLVLDLRPRRQESTRTVRSSASMEMHKEEYVTRASVSRSPSNCYSQRDAKEGGERKRREKTCWKKKLQSKKMNRYNCIEMQHLYLNSPVCRQCELTIFIWQPSMRSIERNLMKGKYKIKSLY